MTRFLMLIAAFVVAFPVAGFAQNVDPFNANYTGNFDVTSSSGDYPCDSVKMDGSISNGRARFTISHNNVLLTGTLGVDGGLRLSGMDGRYQYVLDGQYYNGEISGNWGILPTGCAGFWVVRPR